MPYYSSHLWTLKTQFGMLSQLVCELLFQDEEEAGFGDPSRYEPKYSEIDHSGYRKG